MIFTVSWFLWLRNLERALSAWLVSARQCERLQQDISVLTEARRHKVALSRGGKQVASPTVLPEGPQDVAVILL